nr:OB-fold putative lipoprotein [Nanchangia anserum]
MGMGNGGNSTDGAKDSSSAPAASQEQTQDDKSSSKAEEPAEATPEVTVSAAEIVTAYTDNELAADKQYKGKVVQITGTMDQVTDILSSKAVRITSGDEYAFEGITCAIDDSQVDKAAELTKGGQVTVVGKVDGFNQMNIELSDCTIK